MYKATAATDFAAMSAAKEEQIAADEHSGEAILAGARPRNRMSLGCKAWVKQLFAGQMV